MSSASSRLIEKIQRDPHSIRNVCILAHVDHGKTTLSDFLVSTNGIISSRMAGKMRYLDSRADEQERRITMKSSSISLLYKDKILVNLIDSPGHIDFSSEVSSAIRLCDGALVLVDVLEGIRVQTQAVLRQAWREGVQPCLVINKIDRLITERHLEPMDAYHHIRGLIERINVLTSSFHTADWMRDTDGTEQIDDSKKIVFSPTHGNVIFASALDCWGFSIADCARFYAKSTGMNAESLARVLWGEFYYSHKTHCVSRKPRARVSEPMFVQLVLRNLWRAYAILNDQSAHAEQGLKKLVTSLDITLPWRELHSNDVHIRRSCVLGRWFPISDAVLCMIECKLPSPIQAAPSRIKIMWPHTHPASLRTAAMTCDTSSHTPVLAFVAKMVAVSRQQLNTQSASVGYKRTPYVRNKFTQSATVATTPATATPPVPTATLPTPATATPPATTATPPPATTAAVAAIKQSLCSLREDNDCLIAALSALDTVSSDAADSAAYADTATSGADSALHNDMVSSNAVSTASAAAAADDDDDDDIVFLGIVRVFAGVLRAQSVLHVCGTSSVTHTKDSSCAAMSLPQCVAGGLQLFTLMGRDVEPLHEASAGHVCGVVGLGDAVMSSATLTTLSSPIPPFRALQFQSAPIVRVVVQPRRAHHLNALRRGLQLLSLADANVIVRVQRSGEQVLCVCGELHLERCLRDLSDRFARGVAVTVSPPLITFRECITNTIERTMFTSNNGKFRAVIRATPLSTRLIAVLDKHTAILDAFCAAHANIISTHTTHENVCVSATHTHTKFHSFVADWRDACASRDEEKLLDSCIAFGPRRRGANMLLLKHDITNDAREVFERALLSAFQQLCEAGPLCDEELRGVVLELHALPATTHVDDDEDFAELLRRLKDALRDVVQRASPRLVEAVHAVQLQCTAQQLGNLCAVIAKRRGRTVRDAMIEGTEVFDVDALLPAAECIGLGRELRNKTSGSATPQLVFSQWKMIDVDPFWTPTSAAELEEYGTHSITAPNIARKLIDDVRRRKGLHVDEHVVEHAEKQRTLKK